MGNSQRLARAGALRTSTTWQVAKYVWMSHAPVEPIHNGSAFLASGLGHVYLPTCRTSRSGMGSGDCHVCPIKNRELDGGIYIRG